MRGSARRRIGDGVGCLRWAGPGGSGAGRHGVARLRRRTDRLDRVSPRWCVSGAGGSLRRYASGRCSTALRPRMIAREFALGTDAVLSEQPVARGKQGQVWRLRHRRPVAGPSRNRSGRRPRRRTSGRRPTSSGGPPRRSADAAAWCCAGHGGSASPTSGRTQVRVNEWVDLLPPDIRLDPAAVGAAVAAVHRVHSLDGDPLDPWYCEPVGAARWDDLVGALQAARRAVRRPIRRGAATNSSRWTSGSRAPGPLQVCHRDLWADNLLPTAAGGVCVIDWENCGLADPSQELALRAVRVRRRRPGRAARALRLLSDNGGPGRVDRPGHFSMLIAQLGHIGEIACRDWLEPNVAVARPQRERRVVRRVRRPAAPSGRAAGDPGCVSSS